MKRFIAFLILILSFSTSCVTFFPYDRQIYPGLQTKGYSSGNLYVFNSPASDSLVIFIDGSGMHSVLGNKKNKRWNELTMSWFMSNFFSDKLSLIVPEKPGIDIGADYSDSLQAYNLSTFDTLVHHYTHSINSYLRENSFSDIFIIGFSEGGLLAPVIFEKIENKSALKKMIVWGAGGLSQDKWFSCLAESNVPMPVEYREECKNIDHVKSCVELNPTSLDHWYMGWPYLRWAGFFEYIPFDYYSTINIPVLFVHGTHDINCPVESTLFIEQNMPDKPYDYMYIDEMGHLPEKSKEIESLIGRIYYWIRSE